MNTTDSSPSDSTDVPFEVYLPPGYDATAEKKYPVLYLLHGRGDDEKKWLKMGAIKATADALINEKQIPPLIIVMPYGFLKKEDQNIHKWLEPEVFKTRLVDQLAPLIEKQYRVQTGPAGRAMAGASMGSEQALDFVFRYPGWISAVGCFSPAFPRDSFVAAKIAQRWPALSKYQEQPLSLFHFSWGQSEDEAFVAVYEQVVELLKQNQVNVSQSEPVPGAGHNWNLWKICLKDFLQRLKWHQPTAGPVTA